MVECKIYGRTREYNGYTFVEIEPEYIVAIKDGNLITGWCGDLDDTDDLQDTIDAYKERFEKKNWNVFISNQDMEFPEMKKFNGTYSECRVFVNTILALHHANYDYGIRCHNKIIHYYGATIEGANLIVAAFMETEKEV